MYGEGLKNFFTLFFVMIPLALLGIWKLIDIIVWVFQHVRIGLA